MEYALIGGAILVAAAIFVVLAFLLRRPAEEETRTLRGNPAAEVLCIDGPDKGRKSAFRSGRVKLGRAPGNNIVMDQVSVSGRHAEVVFGQGKFTVEDVGSLNGIYMNGKRVFQAPLADGTQFVIGPNTLALVMAGSPVPSPIPSRVAWGVNVPAQAAPFSAYAFDDYIVEPAPIASGGQATVYRARHRGTDEVVVVKCLNSISEDDQVQYLRMKFEQQIVVGKTLKHPHLVRIIGGDAFPKTGSPYLIEEYLPGGTLSALIKKHGRLAVADVREFVGQACDALSYLHERGIVHKDISPNNMMLDSERRLKLIDFGIAHFAGMPTRTATGMLVGKARYMSPEQARGAAVSAQSDLYALAVVAYELLAGRPPFEKDGFLGVEQHLKEAPPPLRQFMPEVPADVEQAIMRGLAKDANRRFRSARDMAIAFGCRINSPAGATRGATAPIVLTKQHADQQVVFNESTVLTRAALDAGDVMLSRRHGSLEARMGAWWLSELPDSPSANGIYVNGLRVTSAEPCLLKPGDDVQLGQSVWKVSFQSVRT